MAGNEHSYGKINFRTGTLTFEIEQNPEDPNMWGVWERMDSDPDSDEIVASFPDHASARNWIIRQCTDWQAYLRSRGIDPD